MNEERAHGITACFVRRWGGVGAVAHLQSSGHAGRPAPLRARGRAGGRHSDRPRGAFPGETPITTNTVY